MKNRIYLSVKNWKPSSLLNKGAMGICLLTCLSTYSAPSNKVPVNVAAGSEVAADSVHGSYEAKKAVDGIVSDASRWISGAAIEPHWLEIDLGSVATISSADVYTGYQAGSIIENFVLQMPDGKNGWRTIEGSQIADNTKQGVRVLFSSPVTTDKVRFYSDQAGGNGQARLREIRLWSGDVSKLPALEKDKYVKRDPQRFNPKFDLFKHQIFLNQSGFNVGWPKRFTAPVSKDGTRFIVSPLAYKEELYAGTIKDGIGDFSGFRPDDVLAQYVVYVSGGDLEEGRSDPFYVAPYWFQRISMEPTTRFFVDNRSIVGTHPGAFGCAPWEDNPFYAYTVPSLVIFYLSNPSFFDNLPVEIDYEADIVRAFDPEFKLDPGAEENAMEVLERMHGELDGPVGENVPDIIQLIHWGTSWWYTKPESKDYAGSAYKLHKETISIFAYFLYGHPYYQQYFTQDYYGKMRDFAFEHWKSSGLFEVDKTVGTFKGRYCPGWTILPNLMMYEVAKRENNPMAKRFFKAAYEQAEWIVNELDFSDPLVTKGQRMSEHKMMSGLVAFLRFYPERAPVGLRDKLREWADIMISRSNNMWDFRRYDLESNWTLPRKMPGHTGGGSSWNEPGNLAGFPALCWGVASQLCESEDDVQRKKRLNQLAVSHFDNLFGRNPLGFHSGWRGAMDYVGVERGWPVKYRPVCAHLHLARGTLVSCAATEHYPFNPSGAFRHPEGWTAFNAAFNIGLTESILKDLQISISDVAGKQINQVSGPFEVFLEGPVFSKTAEVIITTSNGDKESLSLTAEDFLNYRYRGCQPAAFGNARPSDGVLQLKRGGTIKIQYGYGFYQSPKLYSVQ